MAKWAEMTKDQKITKEARRIKRVLKDLDKNKLQIIEPLIKTAAFMAVALPELEKIVIENGYTDTYQNGANQHGTKQSEELKSHIAMTKNLNAVLKTLADIAPPVKKKESRLQALRNE